jgi:hypothetical protein
VIRRGWTLALAATLLAARTPHRLAAQATVNASLGARYSTTLVHDSIVTPFDVRAGVAPTLAVAVALPLQTPWTAVASVDLTYAAVSRHDPDGTVAPITHVTTFVIGVALRRALEHGVSVAGGAGLLAYLPSARSGIFRDGGGGVQPVAQAAVAYGPPVLARRGVSLEARYDLHGFLTPALRQEGFVNSKIVHRIALSLRYQLRRGGGDGSP